ncbi:putative protein N(5)-glutamine methyltransferase [Saccharopolyspora sp. HNM0983]|uniref:peptide chain release factor N(5)-glutamine methyltransferase n=1 Tax=Saccharopolyspora montiporae TaxID=2781240 RepID=A0A929FZB2_9PSEU|nr:putative protein N(5)-glutamine methyltransferase [Saccharopolyspora sp. HNM0983]MBE9373552.1 putative protein N(5)-glutamine methyltransferase [Saccharopolyspora sp. HNM0983]
MTVSSESAIITRLRAAGCVFAEDEARLLLSEAPTHDELADMVQRRTSGLPLEQVLGWAQFCGLRIRLAPGVFVPRRRTQFLVRQAAALVRPGPVVVDLCCGSGAVGAALSASLRDIVLHAADLDPVAVACARGNLPAGAEVHRGDLYQALPHRLRGTIGLLTVNAPYVPSDDIAMLPPEARAHEPRTALDGGADGLDVLREVGVQAVRWLAPGGHVIVEAGEQQALQLAEVFARSGLIPRTASSADLNATVVIGTRPAAGAPEHPAPRGIELN